MDENVILDRITDLPEFIIHNILSLLDTPVELVRMSVLSKNWFALTASFPMLNFVIWKFMVNVDVESIPSLNDQYVRDKFNFYKYVDYTTSRFSNQNVTSAHTFKLVTRIDEPSEVDIIDKCLGLILKKGLQVLEIYILNSFSPRPVMPTYTLPNILLSASSLTSLTIDGCELPSSLMMVDAIKFKFLKQLRLHVVPIDEKVITCFTTSCPILEEFTLLYCYGFKRFCVYGHRNLRKVMIHYMHRVERIDIKAPDLRYLLLYDLSKRDAPYLNVSSCKKLTTVSYSAYPSFKARLFTDFLSNFPFIENLYLRLDKYYKNPKLSSSSLRTLVLHSNCDLEEIDINTPNLLLFQFKHSRSIPATLVRDSVPSKAIMECYPEKDVDALWFQKLRWFLEKKNAFKVLKLHISAKFIDVEELKVIQSIPPYELEDVELHMETIKDLAGYVAVVDAVLNCFRPRSLSLRSKFSVIGIEERRDVVKFTYEKLLEQEDEGQTEIVLSTSPHTKMHFSNLNSLLTALPRDHLTQTITFIKGEVLKEAGQWSSKRFAVQSMKESTG